MAANRPDLSDWLLQKLASDSRVGVCGRLGPTAVWNSSQLSTRSRLSKPCASCVIYAYSTKMSSKTLLLKLREIFGRDQVPAPPKKPPAKRKTDRRSWATERSWNEVMALRKRKPARPAQVSSVPVYESIDRNNGTPIISV